MMVVGRSERAAVAAATLCNITLRLRQDRLAKGKRQKAKGKRQKAKYRLPSIGIMLQ